VAFAPDVTWLRQVHGAEVVVVTRPAEHAGAAADAAVTNVPGCKLAIRTADCAPVVLTGDGAVGVAHAGWRGVQAGVLQATVGAMRGLGVQGPITASIGPCIHAECYEFGARDLATVAGRYGAAVRGVTSAGRPALDVRAAVTAALAEAGVVEVLDDQPCTACAEDRYFSHRARGDAGRFATIAWLEP
jgi:YfiH family protein